MDGLGGARDRLVLAGGEQRGRRRNALLAADPAVFSTTPHYDGHAIVLVDLAAVEEDKAAELITESWRLRAPKRAVAAWERQRTAETS